MKPANFEQSNSTLLGGPAGRYGTEDDVGDLPVCRTGSEIISCWRASWRERLYMLLTGRVYLRVVTATTHPPVCLEGRNPFAPAGLPAVRITEAWRLALARWRAGR